jgi:hypothetical protein
MSTETSSREPHGVILLNTFVIVTAVKSEKTASSALQESFRFSYTNLRGSQFNPLLAYSPQFRALSSGKKELTFDVIAHEYHVEVGIIKILPLCFIPLFKYPHQNISSTHKVHTIHWYRNTLMYGVIPRQFFLW